MRELSLKEIEMVSGGMRQDVGKTSGGNGNNGLGGAMAVGAISNAAGYTGGKLATGEPVTVGGIVLSGAVGANYGYAGGPLRSRMQTMDTIGLNFNGSFIVSAYDNFMKKSSQRAGTDYQNSSQAGTNYQ
ncbi:hypothetical protein [Moraxella cuniculi]|uniref:Uncharacterized protein n=1 Tax=Moraxella cuniculi TaxID=34061 RepID=A0A448GVJ0_9GAMM|nr:hypothetical protein [Moraxella cuniculi]VEG12777.1 Uncharacterised protein [Moraxella cuniculi]